MGLLEPVGLVAFLGIKLFYVLGAGLLMSGGIRYRAYRQNPSQVRLSEVLLLLLLGTGLVLAPLLMQHADGAIILEGRGVH